MTYPNTKSLIAQSINSTSIIRAPFTAELDEELSALAEGTVTSDGVHEYWGTDEWRDGSTHEWRVHLIEA